MLLPLPCGSRTGVSLHNARDSPKDPPSQRRQFFWVVFLCPSRSIVCTPIPRPSRLPFTNCPQISLTGGRKGREVKGPLLALPLCWGSGGSDCVSTYGRQPLSHSQALPSGFFPWPPRPSRSPVSLPTVLK